MLCLILPPEALDTSHKPRWVEGLPARAGSLGGTVSKCRARWSQTHNFPQNEAVGTKSRESRSISGASALKIHTRRAPWWRGPGGPLAGALAGARGTLATGWPPVCPLQLFDQSILKTPDSLACSQVSHGAGDRAERAPGGPGPTPNM